MKRAELDVEKAKVARKLEESGLVEKCHKLVTLGRRTHFKEHSARTEVKWEYTKGDLTILSEEGYFAMGDGTEIKVQLKGDDVLIASDNSLRIDRYEGKPFVQLKEGLTNQVIIYRTGNWEKEIDRLLEEVPEQEINEFQNNFGY